ncbi:ABC-type transporter, ATPase and permease subunit [Corynebacterium glutamicum MB001]|uniref:ABC-type transporter, ATPase component n=3 Tax=Corynebacterium TaxID=1716 RepID=Q8NP14_CORGL|nr:MULTISPECIES: ABC transporter ATP-binding protein [Corynebacterium]AGN19522.1 ABC-type transport system, involved in lipoprotein release, ATPase component [Corynebacterium glutamicum SCgG1]AGN22547.1 ABC-type transport system, involved in lipoprotein release, ATPase component [Corynebacterium glutamicum SCgG2]AGT05752.1 ABC-type transporter, ATPase and permease subunit [Corynebacterium glutamicum MB001]AIK85447.1 ABC transporter ATP-binding protein [Corynebacterium glutamicum]AIK88232.1 ABC
MTLHVSNLNLTVADGSTSRTLLNNITFDVQPGEVVGITGPSGSGKSTLLAVLGCLQSADSGTATLGDIDLLNPQNRAALRRNHLGIVFQQPNLLPSLTVLDQLLLIPRLGRILPPSRSARTQHKDKALSLLNSIGLGDLAKRKVSELSGGQQARVNLARALMNSPKLLLVDEPTAALDQHSASEVTELIVSMAHQYNAPTLFVSHDMDAVNTLDRSIELVDGHLLTPHTL